MYQDDAIFWAVFAAMAGFIVFIAIAVYVIGSIFMMKIFDKAGVVGKWRAWVPVYNYMVFFKLGDLSPWLVLYTLGGCLILGLIPVVNGLSGLLALAFHVAAALAAYRIGLKLGKEPVWVVLFVLLELVWLGILAFDKSRWNVHVPPAPWAGNAFLGDNTVWDGVPSQATSVAPPAPGQAYGQPGYGQPQQGGYPTQPPAYGQQPGYPTPPAGAPGTSPATPPVPPAAPHTPPAPPVTPPTPPVTPPAPPQAPRTDRGDDPEPPVVPPMQP